MTTIEFQYELINLQEKLTRFANKLTYNKDDAKDLVQETYLKAITNRKSFQDNTNMKAWTFTILKNTYINNYRKATKKNTSIDSSSNQFIMNSKYSENDPDSEYSYNEITKRINELGERFRIPFQMHISGYKYNEIAENLNVKIGTVKSRIFLTRKQLMSLIDN